MKLGAATQRGRPLRGHPLGALFASAVLAFVLAGCGISLRAEPGETDVFDELEVDSITTAGSRVSLTLQYTQPYPVPITVDCDLLEEVKEEAATPTATTTSASEVTPTPAVFPGSRTRTEYKVKDILRERVDPNPAGGPLGEATPVPGTISRSFVAPEQPGSYVVECFTREDEGNFVRSSLTVIAAPTPTATP